MQISDRKTEPKTTRVNHVERTNNRAYHRQRKSQEFHSEHDTKKEIKLRQAVQKSCRVEKCHQERRNDKTAFRRRVRLQSSLGAYRPIEERDQVKD